MFDFSRFQNNAASAIAAFLLASVAVGAAVGPAYAVQPVPVMLAQAQAVNADV